MRKQHRLVWILTGLIVMTTACSSNKPSSTLVVNSKEIPSSPNSDLPKEKHITDGVYASTNSSEGSSILNFHIKKTTNGYRAMVRTWDEEQNVPDKSIFFVEDEVIDDNELLSISMTNASDRITVNYIDDETLSIEVTTDDENRLNMAGEYKFIPDKGHEIAYDLSDIPEYKMDEYAEIEIDSTFAAAIRKAYDWSEDTFLSKELLEQVTELRLWDDAITSLKGVEYLTSLEILGIGSGYISDISMLNGLEKLENIDISYCRIKTIPDLSECKSLKEIHLGGNLIDDISAINNLSDLVMLDLGSNCITSIAPIKDFKGAQKITLTNNSIFDYASIKDNKEFISALDGFEQYTYQQCIDVENDARKIAQEITEGLISDLDKELAIYQYIIDNMEYSDEERKMAPFGYYGIEEKRGVCGDYAEAFCLLANYAGLECIVCGSDTHAWNIVKIDGEYYHCDPTWDDDLDNDIWLYFNLSTDEMMQIPDHQHDLAYYPICKETMNILDYCDFFIENQ